MPKTKKIFLDQNIITKVIKKTSNSLNFENNITSTFFDKDMELVAPASTVIEFIGMSAKTICNEVLEKFNFNSDKDFPYKDIYKRIQEKFPQSELKRIIEKKRKEEEDYNSDFGHRLIQGCLPLTQNKEKYEAIISVLCINTSLLYIERLTIKEREKFIGGLNFLEWIDSPDYGGCALKIVKQVHLYQKSIGKDPLNLFIKQNPGSKPILERIDKVFSGIKTSSDLVDCDLIYLSCTGFKKDIHSKKDPVWCYTMDDEDIVKERIETYRDIIMNLDQSVEHKPGAVFILDNNGKKKKKIIVKKLLNLERNQ